LKQHVVNPCQPGGRLPVELISDRAKRYRANACPPPGPRRCAYCGAAGKLDVEHIDGRESNSNPENLTWACRSCNTTKGVHFTRVGAGRKTVQMNPDKPGAKSLAQYLTAVMVLKGNSEVMTLRDAISIVHNTPHSKRSEFAREIWRKRKERGGGVPF
jgi:HNH endonuclease